MTRIALFYFLCIAVLGHAQSSGTATTKGTCSPAVSGNKNTFTIECGIGVEQGKQILAVLNKILDSQLDSQAVMEKLDELAKQNRQTINAPQGIAIGGGIVYGPTVNNFGPRNPNVTWSILKDKLPTKEAVNPQVWVRIKIDRDFPLPRFAVVCDRPCKAVGQEFHAPTSSHTFGGSWGSIPGHPEIAAYQALPNQMPVDATLDACVESMDEQPPIILAVKTLTINGSSEP